MKKLFIFLGFVLLLSGCGKYNDKDLIDDLNKKINDSNSYRLTATLEIYRNEEKYTYDVDSSYKKGNFFKVDLLNKNNNHQQIILKNADGVYVLTPSLNKSFKFQSDWPYNNSQIYLLQPVLTDITNDESRIFEETDGGYVITSTVNYSTEKDFRKQKLYVDKDKNITKIEVLDSNDSVRMCLTIIDINYKATFENDYFDASKYQKNLNEENNKQESNQQQSNDQNKIEENTNATSKIEDILYPMYVPIDTYLSGQDVVDTVSGERVILTFSGESSFTVVQETLEDVGSTNYVYGDPYLILDTVGSITDYSVSWISDGIEYSVMSDTMDIDELLTVAQSINVVSASK